MIQTEDTKENTGRYKMLNSDKKEQDKNSEEDSNKRRHMKVSFEDDYGNKMYHGKKDESYSNMVKFYIYNRINKF